MLRCCPKTRQSGQNEKKDSVTWKKESYPSLMSENIKIISPIAGVTFEEGETISSDKDIIVYKKDITTERYRLRKVINGIETEPPVYQNNGKIYLGKVSTTSYSLSDNSYEIELTEL